MHQLTDLLNYMTDDQRDGFRVLISWLDSERPEVVDVADTRTIGGRYSRFIRLWLPDENASVLVFVSLNMLSPRTTVEGWDLFISPREGGSGGEQVVASRRVLADLSPADRPHPGPPVDPIVSPRRDAPQRPHPAYPAGPRPAQIGHRLDRRA